MRRRTNHVAYKGPSARKAAPRIPWLVVILAIGSVGSSRAADCNIEYTPGTDLWIPIRLPKGEDELTREVTGTFGVRAGAAHAKLSGDCFLDDDSGSYEAGDVNHHIGAVFSVEGGGLAEASIEFQPLRTVQIGSDGTENEIGLLAGIRSVTFNGNQSTDGDRDSPKPYYSERFDTKHEVAMRMQGRKFLPRGSHVYNDEHEIRLVLRVRRIKSKCAMSVTVRGGPLTGTYFGEVATFGNEFGMSLEPLSALSTMTIDADALKESFRDLAEAGKVSDSFAATINEALESQTDFGEPIAGQDALADFSVNDVPELQGKWQLSLQDVMLGNHTNPGAFMSSFNLTGLTAIIDSELGDEDRDSKIKELKREFGFKKGDFLLTFFDLGLRTPDGWSGNFKNCASAGVANPIGYLTPCPGETTVGIDPPYCGGLIGTVCETRRGQVQSATFKGDFVAGGTVDYCLHD